MAKVTAEILQMRQKYPLDLKVDMSLNRINHWYKQYAGNVYVAFSGGKDSTVLLHLVRSLFPEVPAVFVNTGLEYAPFKISEKCCEVLKLRPVNKYYKKTNRAAYIGTMACDSDWRRVTYMKHGCYLTERKIPTCTPMGFWLQQDIWDYIKKNKLAYSTVYNMGVSHTGCIFCCFGVHLESRPNRFDCMKITHPKLYNYCMKKLNIKQVLETLGIGEYNGLIDIKKIIKGRSHER